MYGFSRIMYYNCVVDRPASRDFNSVIHFWDDSSNSDDDQGFNVEPGRGAGESEHSLRVGASNHSTRVRGGVQWYTRRRGRRGRAESMRESEGDRSTATVESI